MKGDDLSEEDLELKARLEDCVERAQSRDPRLRIGAIDTLRKEIRAATSSMTSAPKQLKFLRAHYGTLKTCFERMQDSEQQKKHMADILSVLALTMSGEGERESLKYCMMGSLVDVCSWGHEYVRNLAFEIGKEWKFNGSSTPIESKINVVLEIVKFHMKHNAETEALDLLLEVGYLEMLSDEKKEEYLTMLLHLVDSTNYKRACLYLTSCSKYLSTPDHEATLGTAYDMYMKFRDLASALRIALLVDDHKYCGQNVKIKMVFEETKDFSLKQQFAFMIARYGLSVEIDDEMVADENEKNALQEVVCNTKLGEGYHILARDIGVMEPKSPEDIYKVHLIGGRGAKSSSLDSARPNLAAIFVNAFVNAGYCQDKLMTALPDSLLFKNNELWKASAVASLGMIHLWDPDLGFAELDKYLHSNDTNVVAGTLLGIGIASYGVKKEYDHAHALISEYSTGATSITRIGGILGLGIAYAGSRKDELKSHFSITLSNSQTPFEELVFSSISLGLVFVGSCNEEIAESIISVLKNHSKELTEPIIHLLPVALGLLYLGKQMVDATAAKVSETLEEPLKKYCGLTLTSLAYAGTGNVLKVQELLRSCSNKLVKGGSDQGPAVLGIALIAMAEGLGAEMAVRSLEHLLQYGDCSIRRAVPLALGMLCVSNPKAVVVDTLSRLSHDADGAVSMAAIISLGLIGAGTNNARIAGLLRKLSSQQYGGYLYCVRIAQGLLHLGKGLLTLDPCHSDRLLLSPVALAGLVTVLHACLAMQPIIVEKYPYMLYILALAMQPRMLLTVDEDLKPLHVPVRVGQAVDVVGQAGSPRTITGFQTYNTPVVLAAGEQAELATEKYIPLTPVLEGFVILRKNPEHHED
ncbi:26S proteasome non-ATPase regulatory subunit 2 homolog A isoform X2 [Triticum aestivum]|uniref:26S proteasome non-ATPase regulatory subunit 2 homolog A isoform X2 n=1 Tax=Triticum aestivum TaxID=4565 RepID=UPI001D010516|nr:26S proteasome non-ATPase regulatory subunit 2 homolog A-like isoform X2 [Triticum aestivum]